MRRRCLRSILLPLVLVTVLPSCDARENLPSLACGMTPGPLEEVCLGMSVEDLVGVRGKVRAQPEGPAVRFVEMDLDSPFYDRAVYTFERDQLIKVTISKNVEMAEMIDQVRTAFLESALQLWGTDFERWVRSQRGSGGRVHHFPVLIWRKPSATVAVVYTPTLTADSIELDIARDPIAKYFFYYLETVVMAPTLDVSQISALDLVPAAEFDGAKRLFVDLASLLRENTVVSGRHSLSRSGGRRTG